MELNTTNLLRTIVLSAVTALIVSSLVFLWLRPGTDRPDPFSQRDFPCQEDEVLGFAPQFGSDSVGCINREEEAP
jgi:hypothetical protein